MKKKKEILKEPETKPIKEEPEREQEEPLIMPGFGFERGFPSPDMFRDGYLDQGIKHLFDKEKIQMIGRLSPDMAQIIRRLRIIANTYNIKEWQNTISDFIEVGLSEKGQGREETLKMVVAKHLQEKPNYYKNYNLGGYITLGNLKVPSFKEFMNLGYSIISPFENDDSIYVMLPDSESHDEKYYKHGDKKANKIIDEAMQAYNLAPKFDISLSLDNCDGEKLFQWWQANLKK
jgi:hypothetical protein